MGLQWRTRAKRNELEPKNPFPEQSGSSNDAPSACRSYHVSEHYVLQEIAGESVLVCVSNGTADFCGVIKLNPSAKVIWMRLQDGATRKELADALEEQFDVTPERAAEDVKDCLDILIKHELIYYQD